MGRLPFAMLLLSAALCCAQSSQTPASKVETGIEGVINVSPVPTGPSQLGSKPLANTTFVIKAGDEIVALFTTDERGHFRVPLSAGRYSVSRKDAQPKVGRYSFDIDVTKGRMTNVAWSCDSGMR